MKKLRLTLVVLGLFFVGCAHNLPIRSWNEFRKISEEDRSGMKIITYRREPSDTIKEIRYISTSTEAQFREKVSIQKNYYAQLFKVDIEPYFGRPDKDPACVAQLHLDPKIEESKGAIRVRFEFGATEGFVYGTCDAKQEIYRSEVSLIYCKRTKLIYELRTFSPKKLSFDDLFSPPEFCDSRSGN